MFQQNISRKSEKLIFHHHNPFRFHHGDRHLGIFFPKSQLKCQNFSSSMSITEKMMMKLKRIDQSHVFNSKRKNYRLKIYSCNARKFLHYNKSDIYRLFYINE